MFYKELMKKENDITTLRYETYVTSDFFRLKFRYSFIVVTTTLSYMLYSQDCFPLLSFQGGSKFACLDVGLFGSAQFLSYCGAL